MKNQEISQALDKYLRLQTFPVAVRLTSSSDEIPEKARRPKRDLGVTMPVCQGVALARRYGWTMAMDKEDMLCALGAITLGLLPAKEKFLDGSFKIPGWMTGREVRAKFSQSVPRLEHGKYSHIVLAPLARADFEPQVIIIYGNPAQLSRLKQSAIYSTGEPVPSFGLEGLACGAEITLPILTGQCQVILTGGGDRTFAQVQDHEASFAIPAGQVERMVQGLEETHKAGLRYPTPSFLTYQLQFTPEFSRLMEYLKQDE